MFQTQTTNSYTNACTLNIVINNLDTLFYI